MNKIIYTMLFLLSLSGSTFAGNSFPDALESFMTAFNKLQTDLNNKKQDDIIKEDVNDLDVQAKQLAQPNLYYSYFCALPSSCPWLEYLPSSNSWLNTLMEFDSSLNQVGNDFSVLQPYLSNYNAAFFTPIQHAVNQISTDLPACATTWQRTNPRC